MPSTALTEVLRDICPPQAAAAACVIEDGHTSEATAGPVGTAPTFALASVTKVFTATMVGQLVAAGSLSFDDPVVRYLPEAAALGPHADGITVRSLLCHSGGLADVWQPSGGFDELLTTVRGFGATGLPGETHSYSNSGYVVLGRLIEQVTGASWRQCLRDRILTPTGATGVTAGPGPASVTDLVPDGRGGLQPGEMWPRVGALYEAAGSTLHGTARDAARLALACATGRTAEGKELLPVALAAEMRSCQITLPGRALRFSGWGLGWALSRAGQRAVEHMGGTSVLVFAEPGNERAAAVLTNYPQGESAGRAVVHAMLGTPEPAPIAGPGPSDPQRYAGRYVSPNLAFDIRTDGETLTVSNPLGGPAAALHHQEGDAFWFEFGHVRTELCFFDMVGRTPRRIHTATRVLHREAPAE
ncbi:serine hydrolase domain-containing protein [Streptomyces sp. NPDC058665]|uniref:serine hydrolase domain-containing protein n=1 Tax=Streptomyces sp. NPDC058665 TaxID=3346586 RepID=UPI00365B4CB5